MNTQRPTPRTDAHIRENVGNGTRYSDIAKFARELESEVASKHGCWMLELRRVSDLERELAEAQAVIKACMSAMPVGNIQTHTPENLAARIGDLAAALARETSENEAMQAAIQEAGKAFEFITSNWTERDLKPSETIRQVFHAEKIAEAKSALAALKTFLPETPCQPGE